jgi:hypothetical protein
MDCTRYAGLISQFVRTTYVRYHKLHSKQRILLMAVLQQLYSQLPSSGSSAEGTLA